MRFAIEVPVIDHPLLNNGYPPVIERALGDATEEIAEEGAQMVRARLGQVLRHPTGYYEGQIGAEQFGDNWEVNDNSVIYGPWLEGVGRRNQTTRFKGYSTFRIVRQDLESRAGLIAQDVIDDALGRV